MNLLRHPHRNAVFLGLLQGVPQGLSFADYRAFVGAGFDASNLMLLICFGLFAPPLLMLLNHFANRSESDWWVRIQKYVNFSEMIFWGGVSLGLIGFLSLKRANAQEGYSLCAFFIAAGIGFLLAGLLEGRLSGRERNAV